LDSGDVAGRKVNFSPCNVVIASFQPLRKKVFDRGLGFCLKTCVICFLRPNKFVFRASEKNDTFVFRLPPKDWQPAGLRGSYDVAR
jgi:hypothetical protein